MPLIPPRLEALYTAKAILPCAYYTAFNIIPPVMKYLILSDLHIGDGSSKDDFHYDREIVELLERYKDEEITLVLNGDAFEILESECVRRLGLISFEELVEKICPEIIDEIERNHPKVFQLFREFSKDHEIVYIVGNHDYYILKNEGLRKKIEEKLEKVRILPFFYIEELSTLVIHGNQFDVINKFTVDRKTGKIIPPLGDFIPRYMMVYFDERIEELVPKDVIVDYDNIRPLLDVFDWLKFVNEMYNIGEDLVEIWVGNFLNLMRSSFAKSWLKSNYPFLRFASRIFLNRFGGIKLGSILVRAVLGIRRARRTDYLLKVAKKILTGFRKLQPSDFIGYELDGFDLNVPLKGIVMGHIHHSKFQIFSTSDGYKFYLNTGTWRPVVEKIKGDRKAFQKKAELFYAVLNKVNGEIDVEINSKTKLEKISPS